MSDIGLMGENQLSLWCAQTDLVANTSNVDKTGWDHIIEFPHDIDITNKQIHASAPQCKIQVKASNSCKGKLPITLSNLQRMVTDPLPTFFLFFEYDGKTIPQRAFLRYIDNELISKVLKKLHKINQSDKENKFNKKTMTIHYDESHLLGELNGLYLKEILLTYFGDDFQKCVDDKQKFLQKVGYENGGFIGEMTTKGHENINKMIDVSLGLQESVELERFLGFKERFGIKHKEPDIDSIGGLLLMPDVKPSKKGIITFKDSPLITGFQFDVDIFISPFLNNHQDEQYRYRVKSEFFDLVVWTAIKKITFKFSLENIETEIQRYSEIINFLDAIGKGRNFDVLLKIDGKNFSIGKIKANLTNFNVSEDIYLVDNVNIILDYFNIKPPVFVSLDNLTSNINSICLMGQMLKARQGKYKTEFTVVDSVLDLEKTTVCLGLLETQIGNYICSFIYAMVGSLKHIEGERYAVVSSEMLIEETIVCDADNVISPEIIADAILNVEKKYEQDYQVIRNE